MMWKEEAEAIDQLLKKITNLGADIQRQIGHFESQKNTLENGITKLDADYDILLSRNEDIKRQSQSTLRLDIEKLNDDRSRIRERELQLSKKEVELQKLKSELEMELATAKQSRAKIEALGRIHVKK